jgi:hypothetical protein
MPAAEVFDDVLFHHRLSMEGCGGEFPQILNFDRARIIG